MKIGPAVAALTAASLLLVACGGGDKAPSGQVVATIGKDEITAINLRNEMGGFSTPDPKVRRAAERQALDSIITRKILAKAAKDAKIDKTPEYAQQEQRLKEALLVQTWQNRLARAVPPPSREEIDRFIAANPNYYGARKILVVDQLRMARPSNPQLLQQLQPLNTMEAIEQLLSANRIQFARGATRIDALSLPPQVLDQILKLPPNELFVLPAGNLLLVNQIREVQVAPVAPQAAVNHAQQFLRNQRTQEALQRQFGATIQRARKDVKYSKAFEPAPPPAKATAKAPQKALASPPAAEAK
jgi:EpsD family peptidyl-prolyl cis-trans isomerase